MKYESVSKLKKKADRVFSAYIRDRDKICITCPKPTQQAGHYVSRLYSSLRYSESNVNGQCVACNIFRGGNMDVYALALQRKYGKGILEKLAKEKVKIKQFTIQELKDIITKYSNALKDLE